MIKMGAYKFPEKCPDDCPEKNSILAYGQSSLCFRCPVCICSGDEPLVDARDYREDWAEAWYNWFKSGMNGLPELYL